MWLTLQLQGSFEFWGIVPGMTLTGFGSGLMVAALFDIVLGAADSNEVGSASGLLSAVQSIASSLGVAVFGTVFFAQVKLGNPTLGLQNALWVLAGLMVAFLVVSPLLPKLSANVEH